MHRFKVFMESTSLEMPFTTDLSGYEAWYGAWDWWQDHMHDDPYGKTIVQWWHRNAKSWKEAWMDVMKNRIHSAYFAITSALNRMVATLGFAVRTFWTNGCDRAHLLDDLKGTISDAKRIKPLWASLQREWQRTNRLKNSPLRDFDKFLDTMIQQLSRVVAHVGF